MRSCQPLAQDPPKISCHTHNEVQSPTPLAWDVSLTLLSQFSTAAHCNQDLSVPSTGEGPSTPSHHFRLPSGPCKGPLLRGFLFDWINTVRSLLTAPPLSLRSPLTTTWNYGFVCPQHMCTGSAGTAAWSQPIHLLNK